VERRHEEGGGLNTEEAVLPGFRHDLHAQYMEFLDVMPMIRDFRLDDLGLRTVMPEAQAGIAFRDRRPPIVLHRPDLLERTQTSIARYSRKDAETFVALKQRAMAMEPMIAASLYNPPVRAGIEAEEAIVEAGFGDLGIDGHFVAKTPRAVSGGTHGLAKAMTQACYQLGVTCSRGATSRRSWSRAGERPASGCARARRSARVASLPRTRTSARRCSTSSARRT
jgi:hypothetical protein